MPSFWETTQRHSRSIVCIPLLVGIVLAILARRTLPFELGVFWFVSSITLFTAIEAFLEVRRKLPHRKRDALTAFLQFGGYSLMAASIAAYSGLAFWTSYRPAWLVRLLFMGMLMFFSCGLVYKRKDSAKHRTLEL